MRRAVSESSNSAHAWRLGLMLVAGLIGLTQSVTAQPLAGAAANAGTPAPQPEARVALPDLMPRSVRAAAATLGLGRQRLALVVGISHYGAPFTLASAGRDTQAVAAALRAGGFVVMVREELGAAALRTELQEFQQRLQPDGVGFIYVAGLGAQVDGQNLLLARGTALDAASSADALAREVRRSGVPVSAFLDALQGAPGNPRLLVLDAAHEHPTLARLPAAGLAEQKLPAGTMALFSAAPGRRHALSAVAALPAPPPTDPRLLAASPFGRELVRALVTLRLSGPAALRQARQAVIDASLDDRRPWLEGDTDDREEFAEASLLDAMLPRTTEDAARDMARQTVRQLYAQRSAGERSVAEVLQEAAQSNPASSEPTRQPPRPAHPGEVPRLPLPSLAGPALQAAATAATLAVGAKLLEASTAVDAAAAAASLAATAAGAVGSSTAVARAAERPLAAARAAPAVPARPDGPPGAALPPLVQARSPSPPPQQPLIDARTAAQPGGGERPAHVPRVNPFGYAEGDTYTYRVLDAWKNEVTGSLVQAIDAVLDDGGLLGNDSQLRLDPQGRVVSSLAADGTRSEFQPFQDLWWADPKPGQRRDLKYRERFTRADASRGETEWTGSVSVGRARKIKLPAGPFEVLPIESSGWFTERGAGARRSGQWSRTVWYSRELGHPVAIDFEETDTIGKLLRRERIELLHAQTARGAK